MSKRDMFDTSYVDVEITTRYNIVRYGARGYEIHHEDYTRTVFLASPNHEENYRHAVAWAEKHANNPLNSCDGGYCKEPWRPKFVRRLDTGGSSGLFLCQECWKAEMEYRKERNKELAEDVQYQIIPWEMV